MAELRINGLLGKTLNKYDVVDWNKKKLFKGNKRIKNVRTLLIESMFISH